MKRILEKVKQNGICFDGKIPVSNMSYDGKYQLGLGGSWTDGFYIGIFYLAYLLSGDEEFLDIAKRYDEFLNIRIQNDENLNKKYGFLKLDHDVGMIFLPAVGIRYAIFHESSDEKILIRAADILAERYNEKGRFIRAWDTWDWDTDESFIHEKKGKAIIDSMMNIPLLFQAAKITGNHRYYEIAEAHAQTLSKTIIRKDYSTFHSFNFNPYTGEPLAGRTVQGYDDDSCWARGQAWAVYGFALAYKYTRDLRFLEISQRTGEYFMQHLSAVDIPCWDFSACNEQFLPWDSSASVICASGMLELYELCGEEIYKKYALRLLKAVERFCLTDEYEQCQGLILHGCTGTAYRKGESNRIVNAAIGQAYVYSDYFYLECKWKLSSNKIRVF